MSKRINIQIYTKTLHRGVLFQDLIINTKEWFKMDFMTNTKERSLNRSEQIKLANRFPSKQL